MNEACNLLGVQPQTLYAYVSRGKLEVMPDPADTRRRLYRAEDVAVLTYKVEQVLTPRGQAGEVRQSMSDTSTWVRADGSWRCVMHTEAPAGQG